VTDPQNDSQRGTPGDTPPGMPRWVKVAAVVVGLLILLFVVLQLTGIAGEHGPGMHSSTGQQAGGTTLVAADG
jgi:hypothetical protein